MQTTSTVFFTNDVAGVIKILITLVLPIILAVLAGVWKMIQGPIQTKIDNLYRDFNQSREERVRDINAVGSRVNDLASRHDRHGVEYLTIQSRVAAMEMEQKYIREAIAEFRSTVSEFRETSMDNKTDIVGKVSELGERIRKEVQEVRDKVIVLTTRVEERDNLKQLVKDMVNNA